MTALERLVELIEKLDAVAEKCPWICTEFSRNHWTVQTPMVNGEAYVIANDVTLFDGQFIAHARTILPSCGKILRVLRENTMDSTASWRDAESIADAALKQIGVSVP